MTRRPARRDWARGNWRFGSRRRYTGLCRNWGARSCGGRYHAGLGCNRGMSGRRSCSSRRRASRARWHNAGARHCARRYCSWRGRLARDSWARRGAWSGRLSRRWCRRGNRCARHGLNLRGLRFGFLFSFGSSFGCGKSLEVLPHKLGVIQVERTRVCLLVRDANLRQIVDQHLGFDLEFSGQLVDADLIWI